MRSAEVVELLASRVPVFATLVSADLERISELAVPRTFEPGQVVFREGDSSDTCYIVRTGHARAIRSHGDGRTITLARFGPGDIFGELAMFEDERRSATVEAVEPTEVIALLGPDMRRLMVEHPGISRRLVIALGRRLRESNERLSRQSFQTVQSRVATVLSELVAQELAEADADAGHFAADAGHFAADAGHFAGAAGRGGGAGGSGAAGASPGPGQAGEAAPVKDVLVTATQAEVAQLAGSSRESASRFLAVLERAGVVSQGRGRLIVHDPQELQQYVF